MSRQYYQILRKFVSFIGPGLMVSVAYMDPGNYATSVSGGAQFRYQLLFTVFISNLFAVVLQSLCVKLGVVTGMDLAQNCRKHLPRSLNMLIYLFAEIAIIATDLAEVIGTAIALDILFGIPLIWGVVLTIADVLVILMFYRPERHSMKQVRAFELFVTFFVASTVVCFILELFSIHIPHKKQLWLGYLPSKVLYQDNQAMYISLGILGATVMPHSLFLGSSVVQARTVDYDIKRGTYKKHTPSLSAIKETLNYSYAELIISLFLVATFVNSAILIVAGATLYGKPEANDADLMSIYNLLVTYVSPAAGLIFALAMLFSGQSAGVICTMAGQIVSEGFLDWTLAPWMTRLVTRCIAIVPCFLVAATMGQKGIADILTLSQVVLSFILPIVSAPLIYFTASKSIMRVENDSSDENVPLLNQSHVDYANSTLLTTVAIVIWCIISFLNLYLVGSFLLGADVPL